MSGRDPEDAVALRAGRAGGQGVELWMRQAIELATHNVLSGGGGPFGAVIVRNGELIATGANCVTVSNDPTAHAEIVAIRNACRALGSFELRDCEIYSSCEPCPMCLAAILWARCSVLYYGNTAADAARIGFDDSRFYNEVCRPVDRRELPAYNLLREQARASFDAWQDYTERVDY